MKYNITKVQAPKMPTLGKGLECIKLLLTQTSKDMHQPLVPMLFPLLGAHVSGTEFQYPDRSWKELCGMMANLVAASGANKGQLSQLCEAICRSFRQHDQLVVNELVEWQRKVKTLGSNKEKPARPEVAFWMPPSDVTAPAFLQNAMAMEKQGGRTQCLNMPEVEMADRLCGGHRQVSLMMRNIYDRQRAGALRATAEGVTGNPILRANITFSSTPLTTRQFYRHDLFNGAFGRIVMSYKPRNGRDGRIPRQGQYDESFLQQLDGFLLRLSESRGRHIIQPLNRLTDRLAMDMADVADMTDNDDLWDLSKRAIASAWKAGCVMWLLNNQVWTKAMGDMVEWLVYHDMWSKLQIAGDLISQNPDVERQAQTKGPKNMLTDLPETFSRMQLLALRQTLQMSEEGTDGQLYKWAQRGFITRIEETGMYQKTESFLNRTA